MVRINIVVEGQSEETFINQVLAPTLWQHQIFLTPILLGVPGHKGGRPNYARVKKDILLRLKQDTGAYCSTMLDFYSLGPGFPGNLPLHTTGAQAVLILEDAIKEDISALIPGFSPHIRLIPYIQLHEYEGLLFSDPPAFANALYQPRLIPTFQGIRDAFPTPEDINDSPTTAPSKRITAAYPRYSKVLQGKDAASAVGIQRMRAECPHFNAWIKQFEALTPL